MPPTSQIDQHNTHRLIPAQFADDGASVLARLTENHKLLDGIFELDAATNDRLLAESALLPGVDARELVFGIPSYRVINAAFCHAAPNGSRFNNSERGAWYASFELKTSQVEVAYHRGLWLQETDWDEEDRSDYVDYLADFHGEFHDLRGSKRYADCLSPTSYQASQRLGLELLEAGSAGIVYPSARREHGTCIACFRPVLVSNVRAGKIYTFVFANANARPEIRAAGES